MFKGFFVFYGTVVQKIDVYCYGDIMYVCIQLNQSILTIKTLRQCFQQTT
jgi:hypothetical protein